MGNDTILTGDDIDDAAERIYGTTATHQELQYARAIEQAVLQAYESQLLRLLVNIRFAAGDNGLRMQPELVEHIRALRKDAERYRWLRGRENSLETRQHDKGTYNGPSCYHEVEGIRELKWGDNLDVAIDAAVKDQPCR